MSHILLAPFSNSEIRDWPAGHYAALIRILLDRWRGAGTIRVIGLRNQRLRARAIVRDFDATRVRNECGRLSWHELRVEIARAACVIGNNSGIAHLSGYLRVPTVCVFGGSHQRLEWRPLGVTVTTISRAIGCAPCHLDHGGTCPHDKACLNDIDPATVADTALATIARGTGGMPGDAEPAR